MDLKSAGMHAGIIVAAVLLLLLAFKTLKLIWKLTLIVLVVLGLSFVLPAFREWIFSFF